MSNHSKSPLFVIPHQEGEPLLATIEQALAGPRTTLDELPALPDIAVTDPYLAQQLQDIHRHWEIRPQPAHGLLARVRTRLAWWLLGPEIRQVNAVHSTLVRLLDSLLVQIDIDRAARRRIEEHLAYQQEQQ